MKITGRHLVVTPALRRHIRDKFQRLDRYTVAMDRVEVILTVNKLQHAAEAICAVEGKRFQAKISTREMYATIDQLVARLDVQIRKYKEQRRERQQRKGRQEERSPSESPFDEPMEVVRPTRSVLTREVAKSQLDSKPGSLIVYTCADSGKLQILQRMDNGQVVLIDP